MQVSVWGRWDPDKGFDVGPRSREPQKIGQGSYESDSSWMYKIHFTQWLEIQTATVDVLHSMELLSRVE